MKSKNYNPKKKEKSNNPIRLNPKGEELTPEKLKTFKGFENKSDEDLERLTETIKKFASVTYSILTKKFHRENSNRNEGESER